MFESPLFRASLRRRFRAATIVVLIAAVALVTATMSPLTAAASTSASISGVVTGADTGTGLANVGVQLTLPGGTSVNYTSTDASGAYTFTDLPAGSYVIQFADEYGTGHLGADPARVTLVDGQTLTGVDAALQLGGSVSGRVSLSTGSLANGASVALIRAGTTVLSPSSLFYIGTAPDGTFSITGISAGSYTLAFAGPYGSNLAPQYWSSASSLATASYFTVTPGQSVVGRDALLQPGSSVTGTVTGGPDNAPLAFAFVEAVAPDGSQFGGSTGPDGSYTIKGLPSGSVTLQFLPPIQQNFHTQWWSGASSLATATSVTVPAGAALAGYDAHLSLGATISGTITDAAGTPIPFASAYAYGANGIAASGFADGSGHYTIPALTTGDYTVEFDGSAGGNFATTWWNGAVSAATATVIHLIDQQQLSGIDAALPAGAQISGTVTGLSANGAAFPAQNATVTAYRPDGSQAGQRYADQSGAYAIPNLPAGTYLLQIEPQGDTTDFVPQWYLNHGSLATATPITVAAGQSLSGVDVTLAATATTPQLTTSTPTISGTPRVGYLLTAKPGVWGPKPVSFTYQWLRSGVPIAGATRSTYRAVGKDAGTVLSVTVTGSKTGFPSSSVVSAPTALVTGGTLTSVRPTITGTAQPGSTLTAVTGEWAPSPVSLAVQWYRDDKKIVGATGSAYLVGPADRGKNLSIAVTGSKPGFVTKTVRSSHVVVVRMSAVGVPQ
jgi:hypothetical protein